ncbi:MAG TPA: hypothetical protein H9909_00065, partial [Candidatus Mediterraneibacter norfolkensis]|nr:hypothetical protein [Candidatus Mediterraneibacter norfolkensis]
GCKIRIFNIYSLALLKYKYLFTKEQNYDNIYFVVTEFLGRETLSFLHDKGKDFPDPICQKRQRSDKGVHMQLSKKSVMDRINRVYNFFSKNINLFCILILVCLAVCIRIDIFPFSFCCAVLKNVSNYDAGNLIAVILVIWTFTATMVVFYLERMESRRYGVRMITIILRSYNENSLFLMASTFMAELLVLIFASIVSLKITLIVSSLIQFGTMIFVFFMVCIETSDDHFRKIMKSEYKSVECYESMNFEEVEEIYKELMVVKMIRNMDYSIYDNLEELEQILNRNPADKNWKNVRKYINHKSTQLILEAGNSRKGIKTVILDLFMYKETVPDDKKGILAALIEALSPLNLEICQTLLTAEKQYQKELYIWCIVLNRFLGEFNDEKWRQEYFNYFFERIKNDIDQDTESLLWRYAEEINKGYREKGLSWIYDIVKYFESGGENSERY